MTYPHDFSEASPKKCISRSGQDKSSRKNEPEKNFENSTQKNSNKNILDKKSKNFSKKIESKNKTSLSNFKRNNSERASQMNSAVSKPTQFLAFPATWWRPRDHGYQDPWNLDLDRFLAVGPGSHDWERYNQPVAIFLNPRTLYFQPTHFHNY